MIVVSDTSPLNYLVLIGAAPVLPALFGQVLAPPAVMAELRHPNSPRQVLDWVAALPSWLHVQAPRSIDPGLKLGLGEAEAISPACELRADAVLIDERKGLAAARRRGLFVTGTLGVLEIAAEHGLVRLPDALAELRKTSFRVAPSLLKEALERDQRRAQRPRPP